MNRKSLLASVAAVALTAFMTPCPASAQSATWINASGGSWNTAANWQDGILPDAATDAAINADGSYSVSVAGNNPLSRAKDVFLGTTSSDGTQKIAVSSAAELPKHTSLSRSLEYGTTRYDGKWLVIVRPAGSTGTTAVRRHSTPTTLVAAGRMDDDTGPQTIGNQTKPSSM